MKTNILLLIGVRGSGKDYFADEIIKNNNKYKKIGFSDEVRNSAWIVLGLSPNSDEEYDNFKKSEIEIFPGRKIKGRDILINVAERIIKPLDPLHFAEKWRGKCLHEIIHGSSIIGHDLRFMFEFEQAYNLSQKFDINLKVVFCNYISDRYEVTSDETEALSVELINAGFKDKDDVTQYLITKLKNGN